MKRLAHGSLAILLIVVGLLVNGCGKTGEPPSRMPEDKCYVRACSVLY
jgi:hypothetical protein